MIICRFLISNLCLIYKINSYVKIVKQFHIIIIVKLFKQEYIVQVIIWFTKPHTHTGLFWYNNYLNRCKKSFRVIAHESQMCPVDFFSYLLQLNCLCRYTNYKSNENVKII